MRKNTFAFFRARRYVYFFSAGAARRNFRKAIFVHLHLHISQAWFYVRYFLYIFADMKINFVKYEGAGNDFVIVDNRTLNFNPDPDVVARLCDRRFGIGADGLMLLENNDTADFTMRYFNSDGPEATMCGNGGRCISLFAFHLGLGHDNKLDFMASDGPHKAALIGSDGPDRGRIALGMKNCSEPQPFGSRYFVDTGSPHCIEFVEDVDAVDVFNEGRRIRYMSDFEPFGGVNVDFVQITGDGAIRIRTYERGVENETLACGTGAVASAIVAAAVRQPLVRRFDVKTLGGLLRVDFSHDCNTYSDVVLSGPARRVFSGTFDFENFIS